MGSGGVLRKERTFLTPLIALRSTLSMPFISEDKKLEFISSLLTARDRGKSVCSSAAKILPKALLCGERERESEREGEVKNEGDGHL